MAKMKIQHLEERVKHLEQANIDLKKDKDFLLSRFDEKPGTIPLPPPPHTHTHTHFIAYSKCIQYTYNICIYYVCVCVPCIYSMSYIHTHTVCYLLCLLYSLSTCSFPQVLLTRVQRKKSSLPHLPPLKHPQPHPLMGHSSQRKKRLW